MNIDPTSLWLALVFGLIGYAAWRYGGKQQSLRHRLLGLSLMIFPYFVSETLPQVAVGSALTIFLFWP